MKIPLPSTFPPSLSTALVTKAKSQPSLIMVFVFEDSKASLEATF